MANTPAHPAGTEGTQRMKRAIYFDDRERDLARRVCDAVVHRFEYQLEKQVSDHHQRMAISWTRDEINVLAAKFDEPPSKKPKADPPRA